MKNQKQTNKDRDHSSIYPSHIRRKKPKSGAKGADNVVAICERIETEYMKGLLATPEHELQLAVLLLSVDDYLTSDRDSLVTSGYSYLSDQASLCYAHSNITANDVLDIIGQFSI